MVQTSVVAPESGSPPEDRAFRPDVQGLRAVAVSAVVLLHAGVPLFAGGFIGVDVFFVISGYVITGVLLRQATSGGVQLGEFYLRRAARILPLALVVIATALVLQALIEPSQLGWVTRSAAYAALFAANFDARSINDLFLVHPEPLLPYWSLGVEEQFYVVYPTLVLLAASLGRRWSLRAKLTVVVVAGIAASFVWSATASSGFSAFAYSSPFTRAWQLGVGALLAVNVRSLARLPGWLATVLTWGGLVAIVTLTCTMRLEGPYPGAVGALPVLAAAAVIAGGTPVPRHGAERLLRRRGFQVLAGWSYAVYLWDVVVLTAAGELEGHGVRGLSTGVEVALVPVVVGLAALSSVLFEQPVRAAAARWLAAGRRPVRARGGTVRRRAPVSSAELPGAGDAALDPDPDPEAGGVR